MKFAAVLLVIAGFAAIIATADHAGGAISNAVSMAAFGLALIITGVSLGLASVIGRCQRTPQ